MDGSGVGSASSQWHRSRQHFGIDFWGVKISQSRLIVVGLSLLVILAHVSGINVERIVLWTWVLAAGLTAVGSGMYGLITAVRPNMG